MLTEIAKDKEGNLVEIIIQNTPEPKHIEGKEINATIDFKYSNGDEYGNIAYFPNLLSEDEMKVNMKFAKDNIDQYKFSHRNLIQTVKDKDGLSVEIEIVNLIEPIIISEQPYHTVSVLRYSDKKEMEYGNRKYWQLPHLTRQEMEIEMSWLIDNVNNLKY